jgi:hypothetical protein
VTTRITFEEEESNDIDEEATNSYEEDQRRIMNSFWFVESLDGFHEDGEAQCTEEDCIDQCP